MKGEILENQLDEKTKSLIAEMEKKIDKKDEELKSKNDEINNLKNELAYLKAQLANRNKKIFSSSSEKVDPNQLSLFNEAEKESNSNIKEPVIEEVCYTRKKPSNNIGKKDNLEGLEKVIIEHKLSEEEAICKECGSPLEIIGVNSTKQILKFVPARLDDVQFIKLKHDKYGECYMLNVIKVLDCLDESKIRYTSTFSIKKYVFKENINYPSIFKITTDGNVGNFVTEPFMECVEKNKLKGLACDLIWDSERDI